MTGNKMTIATPILIIALGVGWLLTTHNIVPGVNWIWILGLAITGILILVRSVDKVTIVVGPFLLVSTFFSMLRQTGQMSIDTEMPCLVIVFGILMLVARILPIPSPKWMVESSQPKT
jgi:hypothetical protein